MAFLQWRRFTFFEKEVVKDPETNQVFDKLKDIRITCTTSGRGQIIIGDVQGNVFLLTRHLLLSCFRAYELNVLHLEQLRQNAVLVSVGLDDPGPSVLIKLWNMDKIDRLGKPLCMRTIRPVQTILSPVTAFAVHENLNLLSIGFEDSTILLVKGDLARGQSKQKLLKAGSSAVTGLSFRIDSRYTYLYAVTMDEVYSFNLSVKDKVTKLLLDAHGCNPNCAVLSDAKQDHQFVIGRHDAVYFYQYDGRGPCLAFEGEKIILHWFRSYLVVVGKYEKPINPPSRAPSPIEMNVVTVYDIQNKFIAYSAPFPAVVAIISEWGTLYVLSQDGKMFNLQEKDTQSKLDMLFRKNQYALAISLAKSQQYDEDGLVDIFRQYGDHLYSKGDHDGALSLIHI